MHVRRATPADAQAIAGVHVASWQTAYRGLFPDSVLDGLSIAERQAQWASRLATADPTIWISEEDRRITGFVSVCPSRDADAPPPAFAEIAALYVHPDAWGTGCGHALCQTIFEHLRQTPAQSVIVWVLRGNVRARHFYERIGFIPDDGGKDITLFEVTLPEVRYRQNLR